MEEIRKRWFSAVRLYAPLYKEGNYHVLAEDGVKQPKEGRRMPGVKKLFQESENSAKPEYIHGHMFGGLGILAGRVRNWACIPLSIRLHDGLQTARDWKGASISSRFQQAEIELYGKKESLRYYCIDLLWGQKLYQELRFVLVEMNGIQSILASTCLALDPLSIIRLYSYRFRIECTFRELKQQVGAFCYHFWPKHMPKLSYCQKKGDPAPLERVEDEKSRKKVLEAVRATEMHMALSCIVMGLLQSLSIYNIGKIRYQRTPSQGRVSEATLMHYFRKHFFRLLAQKPELCITRIIQGLQEESEEYWDSLAS